MGYVTISEPTIPTQAGVSRPDMVATKANRAWVLDTTICADAHGGAIGAVYNLKVRYYDNHNIRNWVVATTNATSVMVGALVMNWRGDLCPRSHALIRSSGIPSRYIKIMEIRNLEGSAKTLRFHNAAAGRWGQ